MLHLGATSVARKNVTRLTLAPSSTRVSMRTAVCTVMCRQPAIRAPFKIFPGPYFFLMAIKPGISFSAMVISFRPHSDKDKSAATKNQQYHTLIDRRLNYASSNPFIHFVSESCRFLYAASNILILENTCANCTRLHLLLKLTCILLYFLR